jgi:hypothetical protein
MNRRGVMEVCRHELLTKPLDVGEWSASRPGRFNPCETAIDGISICCVGRKGGLDALERRKMFAPVGNETQFPRLSSP